MQRAHGTPFNDAGKMLATALHSAGQTDREIADACSTSVNNIIWWRKDAGLGENLSREAQARAAEEQWSPPVVRDDSVTQRERTVARARGPRGPAAPLPAMLSPAEMQVAYAAPVQPDGDNAIEIGTNLDAKVFVDLEELLTTRLLIQGNSGSGNAPPIAAASGPITLAAPNREPEAGRPRDVRRLSDARRARAG